MTDHPAERIVKQVHQGADVPDRVTLGPGDGIARDTTYVRADKYDALVAAVRWVKALQDAGKPWLDANARMFDLLPESEADDE